MELIMQYKKGNKIISLVQVTHKKFYAFLGDSKNVVTLDDKCTTLARASKRFFRLVRTNVNIEKI